MANILIVDDDAGAVEPLARFLDRSGHKIRMAGNGRDALSALLENMPDVVILDLLMPEMDGPSFLEVARSYLRMQSLPVVVLTAVEDSPMIERARHSKVNCILRKSKATLEEIKSAVEVAAVQMPN